VCTSAEARSPVAAAAAVPLPLAVDMPTKVDKHMDEISAYALQCNVRARFKAAEVDSIVQ
jgi:hypothetical protein